jgi:hypothetical protein
MNANIQILEQKALIGDMSSKRIENYHFYNNSRFEHANFPDILQQKEVHLRFQLGL